MKQIALIGLMAASLAVGLLVVLSAGCSETGIDTAELRDQVDANVDKWKAAGIQSYRYEVTVDCYCPDLWDSNPAMVTVKDDSTVSVVSKSTGKDVSEFYADYDSVEKLFATIRHELDYLDDILEHYGPTSENDIVKLDFDTTYGFPSYYHLDLANSVDEQVTITVEAFKAGE